LYISHPHLDHFNGIPELAEQIPIETIIWNECFEQLSARSSPAKTLINHLTKLSVPVETMSSYDQSWNHGGVEFDLLWPSAALCGNLSANDSSTVLQISYSGHSILLTGDIGETAQRALMAQAGLHSDVLLLPHHGSVCASTAEFLNAVRADVRIRSSNQSTAETTNGLPGLVGNATLYNTADVGAVTITIDEYGLRVEPWLKVAD
jgi:competence protein ComEC